MILNMSKIIKNTSKYKLHVSKYEFKFVYLFFFFFFFFFFLKKNVLHKRNF